MQSTVRTWNGPAKCIALFPLPSSLNDMHISGEQSDTGIRSDTFFWTGSIHPTSSWNWNSMGSQRSGCCLTKRAPGTVRHDKFKERGKRLRVYCQGLEWLYASYYHNSPDLLSRKALAPTGSVMSRVIYENYVRHPSELPEIQRAPFSRIYC